MLNEREFEVIRKDADGFLFRGIRMTGLPREFTRLFGFETPMGDTMVKGSGRAAAASDWLMDEGWVNTTPEMVTT